MLQFVLGSEASLFLSRPGCKSNQLTKCHLIRDLFIISSSQKRKYLEEKFVLIYVRVSFWRCCLVWHR